MKKLLLASSAVLAATSFASADSIILTLGNTVSGGDSINEAVGVEYDGDVFDVSLSSVSGPLGDYIELGASFDVDDETYGFTATTESTYESAVNTPAGDGIDFLSIYGRSLTSIGAPAELGDGAATGDLFSQDWSFGGTKQNFGLSYSSAAQDYDGWSVSYLADLSYTLTSSAGYISTNASAPCVWDNDSTQLDITAGAEITYDVSTGGLPIEFTYDLPLLETSSTTSSGTWTAANACTGTSGSGKEESSSIDFLDRSGTASVTVGLTDQFEASMNLWGGNPSGTFTFSPFEGSSIDVTVDSVNVNDDATDYNLSISTTIDI